VQAYERQQDRSPVRPTIPLARPLLSNTTPNHSAFSNRLRAETPALEPIVLDIDDSETEQQVEQGSELDDGEDIDVRIRPI
jgi:hypothetical protein